MPSNYYKVQQAKKQQKQQQQRAKQNQQQQPHKDQNKTDSQKKKSESFQSQSNGPNLSRYFDNNSSDDDKDSGMEEPVHRKAQPGGKASRTSRFISVSGLRGLPNMGNTCFMNAALQALVHIGPLKMYFIRTYFRRLRTQSEVGADSLMDSLIRAAWSPVSIDRDLIDPYGLSTDCVSPVIAKSLVAFMWRRFPFLHPGEQHDSQEFLRCFLNELHDSLKIVDLRSTVGSLIEAGGRHHHHHHHRHHHSNHGHGHGQQGNRRIEDLMIHDDDDDVVDKSDQARMRFLAKELLAMSKAEVPRDDPHYLGKIIQFIQLSARISEQPSDEDDEDEAAYQEGPQDGSNGDLISTSGTNSSSGTGSGSCSSSSCDSLHHSCCSRSGSPSTSCETSTTGTPSTTPESSAQNTPSKKAPGSSKRRPSSGGDGASNSAQSISGHHGSSHGHGHSPRIQSRSIISDIFTGELENTIRCTSCDHVSVQIETFQDLSIPISIIDRAIQSKYKSSMNSAAFNRLTAQSTSRGKRSSTSNSLLPLWPFGTLGNDIFRFYYNYFWSWLEWFASLISAPTVLLDDCLDMFFNPEMLENENRYSCDNCRKLCNGVKCIRIHRLPEVLTIHLNRYQNINSSLHKITSNLHFPLVDFSVRKYMTEASGCGGGGQRCNDADDEFANYELCAVVCHAGSQITNGHYTCYALNDTNFEWYEYDDVKVRYCTAEEVLSAAGANAYILFYQRASTGQSPSDAALSLCIDIEQQWLQMYRTLLTTTVKDTVTHCDPLRDYHLFSRSQTSHLSALSNNNSAANTSTMFASFTEASLNERSITISKYWLNLFLTFMEPGPIDNSDIYCPHRRIRPTEWLFFNSLSVPLIEPVGQLLFALYGGGAAFARLYSDEEQPVCECCIEQLNELRLRRFQEHSQFQLLQSITGYVFKRLKLRKAESLIEFELLGGGPDGEIPADVAQPSGSVEEDEMKVNGSRGRGHLDVMDSLDDNEIDVELNCEKPIPVDAMSISPDPSMTDVSVEDTEKTVSDASKQEESSHLVDEHRTKSQKPSVPVTSEPGFSQTGSTETSATDPETSDSQTQTQEPSSTTTEPNGVIDEVIEEAQPMSVEEPAPVSGPMNLYEEYPEDDEDEDDSHYYLISAEWMNQWYNFINVDFGDVTSTRNRQLTSIYERIVTSEESKSPNNVPPFRRNLNPFVDATTGQQHSPAQLPHPPFCSLLKAACGGAAAKDKQFELDQLWSQIDFNLHTIVPPGPIDNWSLFGIKRKLLTELRKRNRKPSGSGSGGHGGGAPCEPEPPQPGVTTYNELVNLLAQCLGGEAPPADQLSMDSGISTNSISYHFTFPNRLGISEENRSCQFYLLSKEYWTFFSSIYGGGPAFTFDYTSVAQRFNVRIRVSDVEHFIREHYKGHLVGGGPYDILSSAADSPMPPPTPTHRGGRIRTKSNSSNSNFIRRPQEKEEETKLTRRNVSANQKPVPLADPDDL